jgi:hypothetical protein
MNNRGVHSVTLSFHQGESALTLAAEEQPVRHLDREVRAARA